jgi:hypothetical protein
MRCVNPDEASANGHSIEARKKPRLRRTLIGAAIGALLAMSMVPYVKGHRYALERGYLPIYEIGGRADVNVAQLLLNVSFAALVGALASNLSRRAVLELLGAAGILAAGVGLWGEFRVFQEQMKAGAEREETLATVSIQDGNFVGAKEHLRKASNYWWWKGWWEGAQDAKQRAFDEQGMKKQAASSRAQKDEARVMQLLGMTNPFEQFHLHPFYPNANAKEAKQLLLDAAENWNAAGNTYEEQRVRKWEKNLKSADEVFAGLPAQPPNKYVSTDPNFGLKEAGTPLPGQPSGKYAPSLQAAQNQFSDFIPDKSNFSDFTPDKKQKPTSEGIQAPSSQNPFEKIENEQNPFLKLDREAEEAQCRAPLNYPPVKWNHKTEFGKTFAIIKFRERKPGDRNKELDGYAKAIGARFYTEWSRVHKGGADFVEVVFYKCVRFCLSLSSAS